MTTLLLFQDHLWALPFVERRELVFLSPALDQTGRMSLDYTFSTMSCGSSVGIATGYGLDEGRFGVLGPVESRISISSYRPDRLWNPPSLLSSGYRECLHGLVLS
jgi:hypothetical protein